MLKTHLSISFSFGKEVSSQLQISKRMRSAYIILLAFCLFPTRTEAGKCEKSWTVYNDELCIKSFNELLNYDDTKTFCSGKQSTLVVVKGFDMQNFLETYIRDVDYEMWLGGKYDETAGHFEWEDGATLTYSNWQGTHRRTANGSGTCIELKPVTSALPQPNGGKWANVRCQKRNVVICQRLSKWTLDDAIFEILAIRKLLATTRKELQDTQKVLASTQHDLEMSNSRAVIPVGFIYVEYYLQPNPSILWPGWMWADVTNTYAGLFFRDSGGGSKSWGMKQFACAPHINKIEHADTTNASFVKDTVDLLKGASPEYVRSGLHPTKAYGEWNYELMRFTTTQCDVRPDNMAIRIWKRIL